MLQMPAKGEIERGALHSGRQEELVQGVHLRRYPDLLLVVLDKLI